MEDACWCRKLAAAKKGSEAPEGGSGDMRDGREATSTDCGTRALAGRTACFALALSALLGQPAAAQQPAAADKAAIFKDKQIRLIVGSAPGGGYDTYGRLLAQFMRRHIPGNPLIIVQNMPGAGSLVLANYLYNVAPRDGTAFGAVNALVATDPLLYPERVKFDPRQFRWLGSALRENHVGVVWETSPIKTLDDTFQHELIVAGTGGSTNLYPVFVDALLGTKIKMIPGYQGTKQGLLAMERGEVAGNVGITWASLKATMGSWLREGKIRVFVQFGLKPHPELPNVSWIYDYAKTDADRAAMDLTFGNQEFGRPFIAPPGVPDATVDVLRTAFEESLKDPEFIAEAEKRAVDIDFTSGAEIQELMEKIYKSPPDVVQRVRGIVESTAK
jgi:tripartite-type tricarboxylate transporter receptor subunit TctC